MKMIRVRKTVRLYQKHRKINAKMIVPQNDAYGSSAQTKLKHI